MGMFRGVSAVARFVQRLKFSVLSFALLFAGSPGHAQKDPIPPTAILSGDFVAIMDFFVIAGASLERCTNFLQLNTLCFKYPALRQNHLIVCFTRTPPKPLDAEDTHKLQFVCYIYGDRSKLMPELTRLFPK